MRLRKQSNKGAILLPESILKNLIGCQHSLVTEQCVLPHIGMLTSAELAVPASRSLTLQRARAIRGADPDIPAIHNAPR